MKLIKTVLLCMAVILCSCGSHKNVTEKIIEKNNVTIRVKDTSVTSRFANIKFASKYDTSCGMPLSAGLEDTLHYKNKIYGFCSKECKDDFINKLKKDHKK